jgi:3-hydroxyacyl-CoA dehydrogenase/enoyl-CoA hydratase/3-hydroxybutyryl-CoA epimerase
MKNFKIEKDADGIVLATFDMPGRSMNVLNEGSMGDIAALVEMIKTDDSVKGAVITSGKKAFCAGADLEEMGGLITSVKARMKTDPEGAKKDLFEGASKLNMMFRELETCGKPVAAALNGLALGGGFELVLACPGRFAASDNPSVKVGLPEALIGLLPGGGGTQRLPRLTGLMAASAVLLQGKQLKAAEAKGMGIFHDVVPEAELIATAKKWCLENPKAKQPWDADRFKFPGGAPYTAQGYQMFAGANAMLRKESFGNYPAMRNILASVYEGSQLPMDAALRVESRYFCDLLLSPVSGNMIRSLFLSKQSLEKGEARPAGQSKGEVKKVGVIGAGFMGAGVAYVSAMAGLDVVLIDRDQEGADKGKQFAIDEQAKRVKRNKTSQEKADAITGRIDATTDYAKLKDVDLIVEAVFENSELKAKITKMAEEVIGDTAVFGSNTSTIPITDLAAASVRPDNFIGIHFFSPVHKMMLVEIIKGEKTSDYAISRAIDFVTKIRKVPIVVEDTRGFYANRCVMRYIQEGYNLLSEGVKPALIENGAKMAGMPVGPLSLQDEVAIDLAYKVMTQTKHDLGSQYAEGKGDVIIEKMYKAERYGRKNGKGFYVYEGREKHLWPELGQFAVNGLQDPQPNVEDVKDRLMYAQAIEAARTMAEGIVHDPREADLGSIFGWGFAPYTGGAISFIDTIGAKAFTARADELAKLYGPQFEVPALLREMAKSGETFYSKFSRSVPQATAYSESQLKKMLEKDVVKIANAMGIDASEKDLKADTIGKILAMQA